MLLSVLNHLIDNLLAVQLCNLCYWHLAYRFSDIGVVIGFIICAGCGFSSSFGKICKPIVEILIQGCFRFLRVKSCALINLAKQIILLLAKICYVGSSNCDPVSLNHLTEHITLVLFVIVLTCSKISSFHVLTLFCHYPRPFLPSGSAPSALCVSG